MKGLKDVISFIDSRDKAELSLLTELENALLKEIKVYDDNTSHLQNYPMLLVSIKELFKLQSVPHKWNAFDNSHFSGSFCNGAMICWHDGTFVKNEYRRYNFKNIIAGDDYGMMKEMLGRRLKEIKNNPSLAPDVLLIDGGVGQGNIALEVMNKLDFHLPFICLSKGRERIEGREKYYNSQLEEIYVPEASQERLLMQYIRDEVHRFAIANTRRKMLQWQ